MGAASINAIEMVAPTGLDGVIDDGRESANRLALSGRA